MSSFSLPTHGTLIQYKGIGVYLIGNSGVGKSEMALSLIDQGGILICDDGPEFSPEPNNMGLMGICPEKFYGLVHIRDLGVINLIELYGPQAFKSSGSIDFIVELVHADMSCSHPTALEPVYHNWSYLDWTICGIRLHLYPGRNTPILLKTVITQFANQRLSK